MGQNHVHQVMKYKIIEITLFVLDCVRRAMFGYNAQTGTQYVIRTYCHCGPLSDDDVM